MQWRWPETWRWFASTMWLGIGAALIWLALADHSYVYLLLSFPCFGGAGGTPFRRGSFCALIATIACFAMALVSLAIDGRLPRL